MSELSKLRELLAEVNTTTEGEYLERFANGQRIAIACAEFIREHGASLLAIAEAVEMGERGAADPADIIAGALGVSRGYAYGLIRDAVKRESVAWPVGGREEG